MATVVITFFLITQFYVFKMDDNSTARPRIISRRDTRWSMNSQRLEEIVAELMRPIGDVRRSFDTDLSALLEEYLTEAGLHALDAAEQGAAPIVPNFAELALLLQQSASIYSRKVDFLYQHVLSVSESLHQSTQEIRNGAEPGAAEAAEGVSTASARRKRKASVAPEGFTPLQLAACSAARREAALRPPPTLPRMYVELEPRAPCDVDAPLCDYAGEPVGLLDDFHVAWRLRDGFLVEGLRAAGIASAASLRPVPLPELSAAIAASAPLSPPPVLRSPSHARSPSPSPLSPLPSLPSLPPPNAASTPLPDERKRERKRRGSPPPKAGTKPGPFSLEISNELRLELQTPREFSVPATWLRRVLRARRRAVLDRRRELRAQECDERDFRGFDACTDEGGFPGWSCSQSAEATTLLVPSRRPDDSDDDGFFEQSSLGDSDASRTDASSPAHAPLPEWASWRARVVQRAAAGEARGRDMRAAAATLLATCARLPPAPRFPALLAHTAKEPADVSELFLATLFLANAGNVHIEPGAPLALDAFRVRLLTDDRRLYCAALEQPAEHP